MFRFFQSRCRSAAALGLALSLMLCLLGCGGGGEPHDPAAELQGKPQKAEPPTVMAISASARLDPFPTSGEQFAALAQQAFQMTVDAGARGQMTTYQWRELEPVSGDHQVNKLADLDQAVQRAAERKMVQYLGIQVINTNQREMPQALAALPFDDPGVRARFRALLQRILGTHKGHIRYLSIGNEVDVYLRAHPGEWGAYKRFYEDAARYARSLDPAIKVGTTATFDGALGQSPAEVRALNTVSDVMILTYYPLDFDPRRGVTVRDPTVVGGDMARMLQWAGSRPLVLQEIGYPAAIENGSSDAAQAAFVTEVFRAWRPAYDRVPFVNFFLLHDFTADICDAFDAYYGANGLPGFKAFLCSLGLLTVDGRARPAWLTLQAASASAGWP